MNKILITLFLSISFQLHAEELRPRPLGRYYIIPTIDRAHTYQGEAHESELDPKSINVLVWNIKKALMSNWRTEFESYGHGKDLYLIQEANETPRFTQTLDRFSGVRWDLGISFLYRLYGNQATGNMLGANVEPTQVIVKHTEDYEPVVETPKTTIFAKYPLKTSPHPLLVISVHGINLTNNGSFKRNLKQIEDEIQTHKGPVLLSGDFNTRTKERTQYLMSMMKRLSFKTVVFKNGNLRMRFKYTENYLDHGFVRDLTVKNAEVYGESTGSDHKPMAMELSYSH